jgi:mercuric ion transport protein
MPWEDHIDKVGIVGSFIAGACCLGLPAILSIVTAIGLGFLIKDAILLPLMVLFLAVSLVGLYLGYRVHRRPWALILAGVSSVGAFFFIFVRTVSLAAYLAIAGLVVASVLNVVLRRRCAPVCEV